MVDRYVLHQRGWNGDRCRCNCDSFRALVARGGISANCPQEPSIGIRPVVAQARRKLALPTGTNWGGPSCYRAASRIALTCWTDGFAEGSRDIGERRRRSSSSGRDRPNRRRPPRWSGFPMRGPRPRHAVVVDGPHAPRRHPWLNVFCPGCGTSGRWTWRDEGRSPLLAHKRTFSVEKGLLAFVVIVGSHTRESR